MDIDDLIGRMSLTEKIGQLNHPNIGGADTTGAGSASNDIEARLRAGEVGSLAAGAPLPRLAELQRIAVEQSAHGIPLFFTLDVIHGHRTIFPFTDSARLRFRREFVRRTARAAALEGAAPGVMLAWAPMLDVSRDARWGRCAEGPARILRRLRVRPGDGCRLSAGRSHPRRYDDGLRQTFCRLRLRRGGRDYNRTDISPYRMHNVVLPPFKAAVDPALARSWSDFHDLAGIPCTAHENCCTICSRERWGFEGLIVSDYTAILELVHMVSPRTRRKQPGSPFMPASTLTSSANATAGICRHWSRKGAFPREIRRRLPPGAAREGKLGLFDNPYRGLDEEKRAAVMLTRQRAHWRMRRRLSPACC